jgi:hypothetical protein
VRRAVAFPLVGATVVAVAISGTLFAYANWTIPGTADVKTRVLTMPRGVTPSVAKHGTQAIVSWSTQELTDDVPMQRYVVTAHPADGPPVIHTVTAADGLTQSTTFTTAELAGARWYWTLTPAFATWTGEPSKKTDKLTFPAAAPTSLLADAGTAADPAAAKTAAGADPPPAGTGPAGTSPAGASPADTSAAGTSPADSSPAGTSPAGTSAGDTGEAAAAAQDTPSTTTPAESTTTPAQADPKPSKSAPSSAGAAPDPASPAGDPAT